MNKIGFLFFMVHPLFLPAVFSQNTIGLISIDEEKTIGGYSLIYPEQQPNVYLINKCGELVHIWEDTPDNKPGKTAYLSANGNLLRSKSNDALVEGPPTTGGAGGIVEIVSWENELLWSDTLANPLIRQHHDIYMMENGNVLTIIWHRKNIDEMIQNGYDTLTNPKMELWPDFIREINPTTSETVWEWHAWDHMVQDFDSTKANYGDISAHPELIDINYQKYTSNKFSWLHINAIDYDPVKDQILLSIRHFNEIWIIDHSTTTEEAAGHTGGNSNMGGDLLYRWGNPEAYKRGVEEDRKLFFQHDAQWIDDFVNPDYVHFGEIVLYNNQVDVNLSLGHILKPQWDDATQSYIKDGGIYLPNGFAESFSHPDTIRNYSSVASSIQVIGDGHIVMCAARKGFSFELTNMGEVAWEYRTPLVNGAPAEQGTELMGTQNFTFQLERYPEDFPGFIGKDLSPIGYIELNPNTGFCTVTAVDEEISNSRIELFPNPVGDHVFVKHPFNGKSEWHLFDQYGRAVLEMETFETTFQLNLSKLPNGIYFLRERQSGAVEKLIVSRN